MSVDNSTNPPIFSNNAVRRGPMKITVFKYFFTTVFLLCTVIATSPVITKQSDPMQYLPVPASESIVPHYP